MARTAILTKEQIINCAFNIAKNDGIKSITIREIGKRLGKSTAPIYTQYNSMDDIIDDLVLYINNMIVNYTREPRTAGIFLNIGLGFIAFVMENKKIFTDFFISLEVPSFMFSTEDDFYIKQMRKDPLLNLLPDDSLKDIYDSLVIFTYGLATMICTNLGPSDDLKYYEEKLERAGNSIIGYQLISSGIYEDVVKKAMHNKSQ